MRSKDEKFFAEMIKDAKTAVALGGRYRHSKSGKEYTVVDLAVLEETETAAVVYRAEYGERLSWIRTVENFTEEVEVGGKRIPRFERTEDDETIIDKVAWIYIKDGKILSTLSKGKVKFYFPGGKREAGENDFETLTREVKEELTVDILPDTVKYLGTWRAQADGKAARTVVKMSCYTAEFSGKLKASAEIERFEWMSYGDRSRMSLVDQIMMDDLKSNGAIS
jgi:ADP-ribose pyrophosphatase YjhB (NUDIX family)